MGLLKVLRKVKRREREMRILVVGLDNSGKTTLVRQLLHEDPAQVAPTFGFEIRTLRVDGGFQAVLWDIGGQRSIRPFWRNYFEATDGLVWVVDSGDFLRLQQCADELHQILDEPRLQGASLLVIANKQDLQGALTKQQIIQELRLEELQNRRWHVAECSAVKGTGVEDAFQWIVQEIVSRIYMLS